MSVVDHVILTEDILRAIYQKFADDVMVSRAQLEWVRLKLRKMADKEPKRS